ncbi:MAG: bacterial Ig-like domain-containing protein, partial [Oscillospiraceae bacterium]|nr:bacterial Ig-like domain-containing protein [Oscillospiraceae bacterium]
GVFWRIYGILFANDSPTRITGDGELNVTVWGPATSTDWSYAFGSNFIVDGPSVNLTAGDIGLASGRIASGSITIVSNRWAVYTAFSVDAPEYTYWTNSLPEHPGGPGNYYPEDPHVVIGLNTRYVRIDCGPRETEPVTLSEIVITSPPDKTVYDEGDALDLTGLVVTAIYSDGSSEIIDDYTTDVPDGEILDSKYVTKEGTWWISVIYEEDDITKLDSFMIELIAHTHVEDAGTITTPATCDVEGVMTFKCVVCGEILRTAAIPALDHDWGAWTVTTPAECETPGVETRVCANDPAHVETRAIAALEHEWDGGVVTIPPTKEAEGVMTYTCKLCGVTRTEPIPKLPSTPVNTDVEFLQGIAADVLRNGLSQSNLILDGKTLTLIINGREFVLSTNANNRNISGEIALGDGYYLVFDIKGNGVNMKDFKVIQR